MPRSKHAKKPWWHNAPESAIAVDTEAVQQSGLHSTIVEGIREAVANNIYSSRPHAKRKWQEIVKVDNVRYSLICHVEGELIVIKDIKRWQRKDFSAN